MLGAAYASVLAYATLAGVTSVFSWRVYPIPYEWSRLARIAVAGAISLFAAQLVGESGSLTNMFIHLPHQRFALGFVLPVGRLLVRGSLVVAVYAIALFVLRFFHPGELQFVRDVRTRALGSGTRPKAPPPDRETELGGEVVGTPPDISEADSRDRDR
jgi:hypothetical protein